MLEFQRTSECNRCGRRYVVRGTAANPSNETQAMQTFPCPCGGEIPAHVPGSANHVTVDPE